MRNAPTARCGNRPIVGRRPREAVHHRLPHDVPGRMAGYVPHALVSHQRCSPPPVGGPDKSPVARSEIWGRKFCFIIGLRRGGTPRGSRGADGARHVRRDTAALPVWLMKRAMKADYSDALCDWQFHRPVPLMINGRGLCPRTLNRTPKRTIRSRKVDTLLPYS